MVYIYIYYIIVVFNYGFYIWFKVTENQEKQLLLDILKVKKKRMLLKHPLLMAVLFQMVLKMKLMKKMNLKRKQEIMTWH